MTPELLDTSAWARRTHPKLRSWFDGAIEERRIALCPMVMLELLHSAATPVLYSQLEAALQRLPSAPAGQEAWDRALEVYGLLAAQGEQRHRSVKHADLLIAASAELANLVLVHYDRDYDAIASVTGQPARWIAPRGTL